VGILLVAWLLIQLLTVIRGGDRSPWGVTLMIIALLGIILWLLQCFSGVHVAPCLTGV